MMSGIVDRRLCISADGWGGDCLNCRWLNPSTTATYEIFAKQKRFTPETVQLANEAEGSWIGNKDAKNVLVYFHGTLILQ